jgi:excinuclease UvrABC helicase subunit UvrB
LLLSGRRDILVVASVSCGIGNPVEFQKNLIPIEKGQIFLELNYCISCKVYIQEQKILILEISE